MKVIKIIVVVVLALLAVVGWATLTVDKGSDLLTYHSNITTADKWVEEGLYQRAIVKYKEAIAYNNTEINWTKMLTAYDLRYDEDKNILSDYIDELNYALTLYPQNVDFVQKLYKLHMISNDYESAYNCLNTAIINGVNDNYILSELKKIKYSYVIDYNVYSGFESMSAYTYSVTNGEKWGCIDTAGERLLDVVYPYVSSAGDEGVRVYDTSLGSRLIDSTGLVMGIFPFQVADSGIYANGLVPVLCNGKYNYYDSFAKEQFGGYDEAGTFQNGYAAVRKDAQWFIIDTTGAEKSDKFLDIVTDTNGKYMLGSVMVAAKEEEKYQLFDSTGTLVSDFVAHNMDMCMSDGLIAFEKDGKWGFVDTLGNIVITPEYEEAKSFSCGLAAVCKNGKWGFINKSNEVVIDYVFAGADYFNLSGTCMVRGDAPNAENGEYWQLLVLNLGLV